MKSALIATVLLAGLCGPALSQIPPHVCKFPASEINCLPAYPPPEPNCAGRLFNESDGRLSIRSWEGRCVIDDRIDTDKVLSTCKIGGDCGVAGALFTRSVFQDLHPWRGIRNITSVLPGSKAPQCGGPPQWCAARNERQDLPADYSSPRRETHGGIPVDCHIGSNSMASVTVSAASASICIQIGGVPQ
jgi:hypothetical protein